LYDIITPQEDFIIAKGKVKKEKIKLNKEEKKQSGGKKVKEVAKPFPNRQLAEVQASGFLSEDEKVVGRKALKVGVFFK
jgi:hypothetical protein